MTSRGKIVLVHPRNLLNYYNYPSLGLILVGSALESRGYSVKIVSQVVGHSHWKEALRSTLPGSLLVGITAMTTEVPAAIEIARFVKQVSSAPVVMGGWHATLLPEQTARSPLVDYVIAGEGEIAIVSLADYLCGGSQVLDLDGKVIHAKKIYDLDSLTTPNYDLWPELEKFISSYLTDRVSGSPDALRWLPYESSRGCPYRCAFCEVQSTQNWRFRPKSAQRVVSELIEMVEKYRLTHVKIVDDNMPVSVSRITEIAQRIIESGVKFTFDVEVRADYLRRGKLISPGILELLKTAGLVQCTLGLESGSQRVLDLMSKGLQVEDGQRAVRMLDEQGIWARCSFITGYPGETREDLLDTARYIQELRRHQFFTCGINTLRPYPRTPIAEELERRGVLYQPRELAEWDDPDIIAVYAYTDGQGVHRKWQQDWNLASGIAFYNNVESGARLGQWMLGNWWLVLFHGLFALLARVRNRLLFYRAQIEPAVYKKFHDYLYRSEAKKFSY